MKDKLIKKLQEQVDMYKKYSPEDMDKASWESYNEQGILISANEAMQVLELQKEIAGMKEKIDSSVSDCLNIAKGCNDYSGGYHNKEDLEIYKHGISTVVNSLQGFQKKGFKDTQVNFLHKYGKSL